MTESYTFPSNVFFREIDEFLLNQPGRRIHLYLDPIGILRHDIIMFRAVGTVQANHVTANFMKKRNVFI